MDRKRGLLRVLSCGSVDDGKSTLIGRILHDCGVLYEDQLTLLEKEHTAEGLPDFSCLLDGLLAEREQAITIDVAYRSFTTPTRRYIVADAPGHEQYTRNMVTGASRSDVALLLVDAVRADRGLLPQTIRHTIISALMGIADIIVVINKMDCCDYSRAVFDAIKSEYRKRTSSLDFRSITCIPVSALRGDNVCRPSENMSWYNGPVLLNLLESIEPMEYEEQPLRMPVQWVARKHGFRGLAGVVVSGAIQKGDTIGLEPAGLTSTVRTIITPSGESEKAEVNEAVCIQLNDDIDVGRGEMVVDATDRPEVASHFSARIIWLNEPNLVTGRSFIFRMGTAEATATITELSALVDVNTLDEKHTKTLEVNDVGRIKFILDRSMPFAPYARNRDLGGFIFVDRISGNTVGAGMIEFALRRSHSVFWQEFELDKAMMAAQKNQKPCLLWFVGLSASGKSTVANLVAKMLYAKGKHVYILDGDNLRHSLNQDLGFTESARSENIRRASEVAHLMTDAGLVVLAAFISPYREDRISIRSRFAPGEFIEIFVDTPIDVCVARDPKGLYQKAIAGKIPNFTGISAPFEPPEQPELHLDGTLPPDRLAEMVMEYYLSHIV